MKGGDGYTLDEPTQGSVAMYIYDHPGLFVAEPKTPAPPVCPPFP